MTTSALEWRRLDERALAFGRGELQSGKTLARLCEPLLETCEPWARVPTTWDPERPYDFGYGRVSPDMQREELLPARELWQHLRNSRGDAQNILLFEDPLALPTDESIVAGTGFTPVVVMDDEVYEMIDRSLVGEALHLPVAEYPNIGIATTVPPDLSALEDRASVTRDALAALADRAVAIIVGAWDAESYVVFDRGLLERTRSDRTEATEPGSAAA